MLKGTVKFFNIKNQFGFIREEATGKEYYVHATDIENEIAANDWVQFELKEAKRGPQAVQVKKITAAT